VELIGQGAGAKWRITVGAPDRYPNDLDDPTGTPPNPLSPLPPDSWRRRSIVILWLKYNRGRAKSWPFLSQIRGIYTLVRRRQESSLCACIVKAVEQSSNLGEVLHLWMEFAESGDRRTHVCQALRDVLYCPRHDIHPCNIYRLAMIRG
jgi:hypothetical protein